MSNGVASPCQNPTYLRRMDKKVFNLEESSGAFSGVSWTVVEDMMALYASGDSIANLGGIREMVFFA